MHYETHQQARNEIVFPFVWRTRKEFSYERSSPQSTSQEADVSTRQHTVPTLPWLFLHQLQTY